MPVETVPPPGGRQPMPLHLPTPSATTRLLEIEETTEDRGHRTSDRRRRALVVGIGKQQSYDFYQLLLGRLRIYSAIMAGALAGVMTLMLWNLYTAISGDRLDELGGAPFVRFVMISIGLPLFVSAVSAIWLRWRPPATTAGLRAIELFIIGAVAAVMLWGMAYPEQWYRLLERTSAGTPLLEQQAFMGVYVEFTSLRWFALLTGTPPFAHPSIVGILAAHLHETARPPSERRSDVPADLEAVVLRCLAKDPNDRFPDARSLGRALAACRAASEWSPVEAASWWQIEYARECR